MKNVYLINLSFGLAGIERRFANLWRVLHRRKNVFPILAIPAPLAGILDRASLLPSDPEGLIVIPEPAVMTWTAELPFGPWADVPKAIVRSRVSALGYRPVWRRITDDPNAVVHIGMNASAMRPPRVPTVYECVDATLTQLGRGHFRRAAKRRCIVHCQTERIRNALESHHVAPRWRTVTSPMYFAHYADAEPAERDSRMIAFVGRLSPEKNPLLFIGAVASARQRGVDCRAVMLGEGPLQAGVEKLIERLGLEPFVSVRFLANPAPLLRQCAISVTLQTGDNYGSQSLLESMGAGCAIIASDVGETARIVTDEVGVRVPLTLEAVAGAIERLVSSGERTRAMGERAEELARTRFSADAYAEFLESLYDRACEYHAGGIAAAQ